MHILASIWKILTLSCAESTQLVSASIDEPLGWSERVAVRLHMCICRGCRRFREQIRFLEKAATIRAAQDSLSDTDAVRSLSLSPEGRQRIEKVVRRNLAQGDH